MITTTKLDFKLADMNGTQVYLAEPYKVVSYSFSHRNGRLVEIPCWKAYYRIYDKYSKKMLFGDGVEMVGPYESKEYSTKEEAMAACQKRHNSESTLS
jgi:hypothetical protein